MKNTLSKCIIHLEKCSTERRVLTWASKKKNYLSHGQSLANICLNSITCNDFSLSHFSWHGAGSCKKFSFCFHGSSRKLLLIILNGLCWLFNVLELEHNTYTPDCTERKLPLFLGPELEHLERRERERTEQRLQSTKPLRLEGVGKGSRLWVYLMCSIYSLSLGKNSSWWRRSHQAAIYDLWGKREEPDCNQIWLEVNSFVIEFVQKIFELCYDAHFLALFKQPAKPL